MKRQEGRDRVEPGLGGPTENTGELRKTTATIYHLHAGYRCGITTHPITPHTAYPIAPTHLRHSKAHLSTVTDSGAVFAVTDEGAWMVTLSVYPKTMYGCSAAWTS